MGRTRERFSTSSLLTNHRPRRREREKRKKDPTERKKRPRPPSSPGHLFFALSNVSFSLFSPRRIERFKYSNIRTIFVSSGKGSPFEEQRSKNRRDVRATGTDTSVLLRLRRAGRVEGCRRRVGR